MNTEFLWGMIKKKYILKLIVVNVAELCEYTKKKKKGSSHRGAAEMNLTSIREDTGWIPGLNQWVKDLALM